MAQPLNLPTQQIITAYESGTSAYRLAKDHECSIWAIITRLRAAGVKMRPDGTPKSLSMTASQRKIFDSLNVGLLLGDASINGNSTTMRRRCALRLEQTNKRFGWLEQVKKVYADLGVHVNIIPIKPKKKIAKIEGRRIKTNPSSLLYTGVSDEFRNLRKNWYPDDGIKRVPTGIKLCPLSIAMWFCGDGSCNSGRMMFYTNGFLEPDTDMLVIKLRDVGIHASKAKTQRNGQFKISVHRKMEAVKIRDMILPHMPECCLYKLQSVEEPKKSSSPVKARLFTPDQVRQIRLLKRSGVSYRQLVDRFGGSQGVFVNIIAGKTYRDVV